jgi:DNA processing protein
MIDRERHALLTLTLVPGLGPTLTRRCVEAMGGALAVLDASVGQLAQVRGIGPKRAPAIRGALDGLSDGAALEQELALIGTHGARVLASTDDDFPATLRHIPDVPPLLYVRGQLHDDDAIALAIVGSRRCTQYGRQQADRLAALCAQAGFCIVSGGAYGIDAAAHRATVRARGRTVVVLGSGLARPYPTEHIDLFDQIADGRGAVVSELPMMAAPLAENFPRRNRIISGLALGVLVIEAAQRSGALLTARLAAEEHGREVMALPGRVDSAASAGCHKMIREGWACLVTDLKDILDALGETGQLIRAGESNDATQPRDDPPALKLSNTQQKIVTSLAEPRGLDGLCAATGLSVQVIQSDLTMLEIKGLVEKSSGVFSRR